MRAEGVEPSRSYAHRIFVPATAFAALAMPPIGTGRFIVWTIPSPKRSRIFFARRRCCRLVFTPSKRVPGSPTFVSACISRDTRLSLVCLRYLPQLRVRYSLVILCTQTFDEPCPGREPQINHTHHTKQVPSKAYDPPEDSHIPRNTGRRRSVRGH